jgi:hypothetical protein
MVQFDSKAQPVRHVALSPQETLSRSRAGAGIQHGGRVDPKATRLVGGADIYLRALLDQLGQWFYRTPPLQGSYRSPQRALPLSKDGQAQRNSDGSREEPPARDRY